MHLKELKNRIDRAEAGPVRPRDLLDMTDEELIEAAGLAPYWPNLTERQRDQFLARLAEEPAGMTDEEHAAAVARIAEEMTREERHRAADRLRSAIIRERAARSTRPRKGRSGPWIDKADVLAAIPTLETLAGFEGYGPHPHHSKSATGANLHITGDQWYFFREGWRGGGGPLEWFACYEMDDPVIKEGEKIPRDKFVEVLEAAADRYIPGWRDRSGEGPA